MSVKVAALVAVLLGCTLPAPSASPAAAQEPPPLVAAGVTTLRATGSGVVDMVLPGEATFTMFDTRITGVPSMSVLRKDGFAGVRIVRKGSAPGTDLDITALAFKMPVAGEQSIGVAGRAREDRNAVDPLTCTVCRLPAGAYQLYVLTDGPGATDIRLTFKGLTGTKEHSAFAPVAARFAHSTGFTGASTDAGGFAAAGAEAPLAGRGTVVQLDYFDTNDRAAAPGLAPGGVGDYGFCTYPSGKLPQTGVLPGCPGGTLGVPTFLAASVTGGYGFGHIGVTQDTPAGPYAAGAYATHAGLPFRSAGTTLVTIPTVQG